MGQGESILNTGFREFYARGVEKGHVRNHLIDLHPDSWIHGDLHVGIALAHSIFFDQPFQQMENGLRDSVLQRPGIVKGNQVGGRLDAWVGNLLGRDYIYGKGDFGPCLGSDA